MLRLLPEPEKPRLINGKPVKVWKNTTTESEIVTYYLRTDKFNNTFWAFEDLFALPFIRQSAAKKVLDLYGHGLHLEDIRKLTGEVKIILKGNSPEKYEQAYSKILELENLSETMADPVRQCMGLCTVYLLYNDEAPDVWNNQINQQKMTAMANDPDSQAFFLNWWIDTTQRYGQALNGLSRIASIITESSVNGSGQP